MLGCSDSKRQGSLPLPGAVRRLEGLCSVCDLEIWVLAAGHAKQHPTDHGCCDAVWCMCVSPQYMCTYTVYTSLLHLCPAVTAAPVPVWDVSLERGTPSGAPLAWHVQQGSLCGGLHPEHASMLCMFCRAPPPWLLGATSMEAAALCF